MLYIQIYNHMHIYIYISLSLFIVSRFILAMGLPSRVDHIRKIFKQTIRVVSVVD